MKIAFGVNLCSFASSTFRLLQTHLPSEVQHAGEAAKIQVTERQLEILEEIVASRAAAVRLVQRAKIVMLAFAKHNNEEIGEIVGLNPQQVSVRRKRWRDKWSRLFPLNAVRTHDMVTWLGAEIDVAWN